MDFALIVSLVVTLVGAVLAAITRYANYRENIAKGKASARDALASMDKMLEDLDLDVEKVTSYDFADEGEPSIETEGWKDSSGKMSKKDKREGAPKRFRMLSGLKGRKSSPAKRVLVAFAFMVLALGILTVWRYMDSILQNTDVLLLGFWLFLTMVAGMFVQVLASNYRQGYPLFDVDASQLVFPLLFSIVVFYPVWAIGASAEVNLFSFHAAFLNGYFWESVVSSARLPQAE